MPTATKQPESWTEDQASVWRRAACISLGSKVRLPLHSIISKIKYVLESMICHSLTDRDFSFLVERKMRVHLRAGDILDMIKYGTHNPTELSHLGTSYYNKESYELSYYLRQLYWGLSTCEGASLN